MFIKLRLIKRHPQLTHYIYNNSGLSQCTHLDFDLHALRKETMTYHINNNMTIMFRSFPLIGRELTVNV